MPDHVLMTYFYHFLREKPCTRKGCTYRMKKPLLSRLVFALLLVALLGVLIVHQQTTGVHSTNATTQQHSRTTVTGPIKHIVFILKENRSFDSYFGTFPGANGSTTGVVRVGL